MSLPPQGELPTLPDARDPGFVVPPAEPNRLTSLLGLLARLLLGAIMIYAGGQKILEGPVAAARAVQAYQILPFDVATYVGYALPYVEVVLGALLVLGLFTRFAAAAVTVLLLVFVAGIASAWARGLSIDCGCFGGGGAVAPGATQYPRRIAEDVGMALLGLWLVRHPRTLFALDRMWG